MKRYPPKGPDREDFVIMLAGLLLVVVIIVVATR